MDKINLIFPVAGEASRFGGTFKPFLNIGDITFIETTFKPFKKWISKINKIYFICTSEQEEAHDVTLRLKDILPYDFLEVVVIGEKTKGPYQTLKKGINQAKISGPSIICDCDHSLNVDNIFNTALEQDVDCVIPTWSISKDEWMNWSKVVLDSSDIKMICEKERISSDDYEVKGIIGCIYLNTVEDKFKSSKHLYVSDCLQQLLKQNKIIKTTDTEWASFYGDKKMLEKHVDFLRKKCSIFCDIDGVLVHHHPHSTPDLDKNKPIDECKKLNSWKALGHKIILTTARSEKYRDRTTKLLKHLDIQYDQLVMGLPAGPRILINDHKPSKEFANQANAIELVRDKGLKGIDITKYQKEIDTVIEKTFEGGSFATTYRLKDNIVRKHIIKNEENIIHYKKLKRQVADLERFSFLWQGCTPKIFAQKDTDFDFSFDMEYLRDYSTLSDIHDDKDKLNALTFLLRGMNTNVYQLKKEIDGIAWLNNHYEKKIFSKFANYSEDEDLQRLIFNHNISINGQRYSGLRKTLLAIDKHLVKPNFIRPIHGDFTLENIMWNGKQIKLIDTDGSDIFDAAELDLGKMSQSIFSKFNEWKNADVKISIDGSDYRCTDKYFDLDIENNLTKNIISHWSSILKDDKNTIINKGIFYMCMYFIRFVPFRMKVSKDHGVFALLMAIVWLNKLIKNEN